jgi:hypothetical protein
VKPLTKAALVALIQVLIVCSLGAKLLYDRHTRPEVWFKTARYDPNLPIRGRYLGLQIELNDPRSAEEIQSKFGRTPDQVWMGYGQECGSIEAHDGSPVVVFDSSPAWNCDNLSFSRWRTTDKITHLRLGEPLLFFIPDTAKDPRGSQAGDQVWVLATIPRKGPPRPIALGLKKAGESGIQRLNLN